MVTYLVIGLLAGLAGGVVGVLGVNRAFGRELRELGADLASVSRRLSRIEGRTGEDKRAERRAAESDVAEAVGRLVLESRPSGGGPASGAVPAAPPAAAPPSRLTLLAEANSRKRVADKA